MTIQYMVDGKVLSMSDDAWATLHPPEPPQVPQVISDRQFFQQLAVLGKITEAEALAYVAGGNLPSSMVALIGQLPGPMQFGAKMQVIGANEFLRSNALVSQLGSLYGFSSADLDALWTAAALL